MIQLKCSSKIRDNKGNIVEYFLIDYKGSTRRLKPDELKFAISIGYINVINLKLTSDNRLIDKKIIE